MKLTVKLWIGIAVLVILVPLGLLLPEHFNSGGAWGEWGVGQIHKLSGYIPKGMYRISKTWRAPFQNYAFKGWEEKGLSYSSFAYIISAIIGVVVCGLLVLWIGRKLIKKGG